MEPPTPLTQSKLALLAMHFVSDLVRGGNALLVATTLCMTLTICIARPWWIQDELQEKNYKNQVQDLLTQSSDPATASRYPVFMAALRENLASHVVDCRRKPSPQICSDLQYALTRFQKAMRIYNTSIERGIRELRDLGAGLRHDPTEKILACAAASGRQLSVEPEDPAFRPAGCGDGGGESYLFVPATLNISSRTLDAPRVVDGVHIEVGPELEFSDRTLAAVSVSANLGGLARKLLDTQHADARIVQVYYVSREDVLRVWRTKDPQLYKHVLRSSIADRHLRPFLAAPHSPPTYSDIYFDVTEAGLVQTACAPHLDGTARSVLGALCVDFASTARGTNDTFPLLDVCLAERRLGDPGRGLQPLPGCGLDAATLRHLDTRIAVSGAQARQDVVFIDEHRILLVQAAVGESELYAIATVRPLDNHDALNWALLGALVSSTALCITGVVRSLRRQALEAEDGMLRNLQVGVLLVGDEDRILEANDRAEEIIGHALPSLGAGERGKPKLTEFFKTPAVRLASDGRSVEIITQKDIQQERSEGRSTQYYLKKSNPTLGRPKREWIHVYGSPWLLSRRYDARTFAVISPVSQEKANKLDTLTKNESFS